MHVDTYLNLIDDLCMILALTINGFFWSSSFNINLDISIFHFFLYSLFKRITLKGKRFFFLVLLLFNTISLKITNQNICVIFHYHSNSAVEKLDDGLFTLFLFIGNQKHSSYSIIDLVILFILTSIIAIVFYSFKHNSNFLIQYRPRFHFNIGKMWITRFIH